MKWIEVEEQLPPDNSKLDGEEYLVTVVCASWEKPKTMVMGWETCEVKGKMVKRWKWNRRIKLDSWIVTHWSDFPSPAIN